MIRSHRQSEFCTSLMYHESDLGKAGYGKICPRLRKSSGLADQATRLGGSPHLSCRHNQINPRTYKQIHTPTMVQGGVDGASPPPWVFDMLQFFDTILPWMESLGSSSLVYFMGGGAAGGLWRHQTWSPSWPPSWILSRFKNKVKTVRINNFLHLIWKITHK